MKTLYDLLKTDIENCGVDVNLAAAYFKNHNPRGDEEATYARFALDKLKSLTDLDHYLIIAGFIEWLELYATPDMLPEIREMRKTLPPRPGLRDYRVDADMMISVLENKGNGICLCQSKKNGNTSPHDPLFKIDSSEVKQEEYLQYFQVHCIKCNTKFTVVEDPGYHYPIYRWS